MNIRKNAGTDRERPLWQLPVIRRLSQGFRWTACLLAVASAFFLILPVMALDSNTEGYSCDDMRYVQDRGLICETDEEADFGGNKNNDETPEGDVYEGVYLRANAYDASETAGYEEKMPEGKAATETAGYEEDMSEGEEDATETAGYEEEMPEGEEAALETAGYEDDIPEGKEDPEPEEDEMSEGDFNAELKDIDSAPQAESAPTEILGMEGRKQESDQESDQEFCEESDEGFDQEFGIDSNEGVGQESREKSCQKSGQEPGEESKENTLVKAEGITEEESGEVTGPLSQKKEEGKKALRGTVKVQAADSKGEYRLPSAGGCGLLLYRMGGILLILLSGLMFTCHRSVQSESS